VLKLPQTREQLHRIGYEAVGSTPAQFAAFLKAEMVRWGKVVKDAGIQAV
jgi:tripartite-type tricarboxylate transporter receptor subunit TctC